MAFNYDSILKILEFSDERKDREVMRGAVTAPMREEVKRERNKTLLALAHELMAKDKSLKYNDAWIKAVELDALANPPQVV